MIGTLALNIWVGIAAFVITFFSALAGNVIIVSLERAFYAFVLFFLATFVIRWLIQRILASTKQESGTHVDLITPPDVEGEMPQASENEPSEAETFKPLVPPRIERTDQTVDSAQIANAIRRLTDE
jgi:hypothetical protein